LPDYSDVEPVPTKKAPSHNYARNSAKNVPFVATAHAQASPEDVNVSPSQPVETKVLDAVHGNLPTEAIPEVTQALDLDKPTTAYTPEPTPDNVFSVWVGSPVEVTVTSPSGDTISRSANSIGENAYFSAEDDPAGVKFVFIEDAPTGEYQLRLDAIDGGGTYHVAAGNFTEDTEYVNGTSSTIAAGESVVHTVQYEPSNTQAPTDISAPKSPSAGPETLSEALAQLLSTLTTQRKEDNITRRGIYQTLQAQIETTQRFAERIANLEDKDMSGWRGRIHRWRLRIIKRVTKNRLEHMQNRLDHFRKRDHVNDTAHTQLSDKIKTARTFLE
jgi:hypothetical protein